MAEYAGEVGVGFLAQAATGTFNPTLAAITTAWDETGGLLLGDSESGINGSGVTLGLGRSRRDKAFIGSTRTRSLSDFLAAEVPTFTFAFPFCGNRVTVAGAPADADAVPIAGVDAILYGCGMAGTAWGTGVGHQYVFADGNFPISALLFISGNRFQLKDCRCSLSINFEPGNIPIATATVEVGAIDSHTADNLPTGANLDYGEQASVSAPVIEGVANGWDQTRGFSEATLSIAPTFTDVGDSNLVPPVRKLSNDREVTFTGTLYADAAHAEGDTYEYTQLINEAQASMDPLSFLVGTAMADTLPAEAVGVVLPLPELTDYTPAFLGTYAGNTITLVARGDSAGGGNDELQLNFQ